MQVDNHHSLPDETGNIKTAAKTSKQQKKSNCSDQGMTFALEHSVFSIEMQNTDPLYSKEGAIEGENYAYTLEKWVDAEDELTQNGCIFPVMLANVGIGRVRPKKQLSPAGRVFRDFQPPNS